MRAFALLAETLPSDGLRLLRYACLLDLADAPALETRIFCDGRITAIERELRRRGEPISATWPSGR